MTIVKLASAFPAAANIALVRREAPENDEDRVQIGTSIRARGL